MALMSRYRNRLEREYVDLILKAVEVRRLWPVALKMKMKLMIES